MRPFAGFRIVGYVDAPVFHIEGPVGWFGLVVSGEYEEFAIVFKGGCVCGIVVLRQVVGGIGSFVLRWGCEGCRQRTVVDLCDGDVGIADRQIVVGVSGDAGRGTCVGRVAVCMVAIAPVHKVAAAAMPATSVFIDACEMCEKLMNIPVFTIGY